MSSDSHSKDKDNSSVADDLEWEEWKPDEISFTKHMLAGSVAGLAEHIVMFPVDTIKTHLQCQRCGSNQPMQTLTCASRIVGTNGVFSLWRGVSAMFAGCIPAHAAYFGIFEFSKRQLGIDRDGHHPVKAAFCGAGASVSHDLFMTPFDTLKQRMQIGQYRTMYQCLTSLIRTEGVIALYLSFPMTFVMNIPYGGIMVAVNESMKKILNSPGEEKLSSSLTAGCIAGGIAALITTPLDVIKTRLQTQEFESPFTSPSSNASTNSTPLEKCPKASESKHLVKGYGEAADTSSCRPNNCNSSSSNSSSTRKAMNYGYGSSSGSSGNGAKKNVYTVGGYPNPNIRSVSEVPPSSARSAMALADTLYNPSIRKGHKGVVEIVKRLLAEDGWRGFMRGAVARVMVQAPAAAISWTTYDFMKSLLNKQDIIL